MLGVRLREHHELDVGGIAFHRREVASPGSRSRRRTGPAPTHGWPRPAPRDRAPARRCAAVAPSPSRTIARPRARSNNAVSVMRSNSGVESFCSCPRVGAPGVATRPDDAALDPSHRFEATYMRDVGGLARPGRDGAETRHDDDLDAGHLCGVALARPIGEQARQQLALARIELTLDIDEVDETRADRADAGLDRIRARGAVWRCGNRKLRGRREARSFEAANYQGLAPHFQTPSRRHP